MSPQNSSRVLVVGGTGPTGPAIVNRFLRIGANVTIYHSGAHEAEFEGEVEHLHGDPREPEDIRTKLGQREWEIAVLTSGGARTCATRFLPNVSELRESMRSVDAITSSRYATCSVEP